MDAELRSLLLQEELGFKLKKEKRQRLAELKAKFAKVTPPKQKKVVAPKGYKLDENRGIGGTPELEPKPKKTTRRKKTTNEIKPSEKETGKIENITTES